LPIFQTETGYNNVLKGRGQPGVPEDIAAKYGPRLVAEELRTQTPGVADNIQPGISMMNFYELADESVVQDIAESGFGLIRLRKVSGSNETIVTPKPIYFALQRLIRYLYDEDTHVTPLSYSITSARDSDSLHHLLLEKGDGSYCLLLWLEVPASVGVSSKTATAQIVIPGGVTSAEAFFPTSGNRNTLSASKGGAWAVEIGDELQIVRFIPRH
jgi:hypothetical protein